MENLIKLNTVHRAIDIIILLITSTVLAIIAAIWIGIPASDDQNIYLFSIVFLIIVIVYTLKVRKTSAEWLGIDFTSFTPTLVIRCILIGVSLFCLAVLPFNLKKLLYTHSFEPYGSYDSFDFLSRFIARVILVPLSEEIFFRGMLLRALWLRVGFKYAALLSSIFFSLSHLGSLSNFRFFGFMHSLIIGILFCYVFKSYKGVIASTITHGVYNLCVEILYVFIGIPRH
jgi:membrane protease YdiL (CAAX protease family)